MRLADGLGWVQDVRSFAAPGMSPQGLRLNRPPACPTLSALRRLCHGILDHQNGRLQDDTTLLLLVWTGPR